MVFSSAIFLFFFLPAVFLLDRVLPGVRAKNICLLLASLLFYSFGQLVYLPLLLLSALINYLGGRMAAGKHARAAVTAAIIGNVALLAVFKYADFLLGTVNGLFGLSLPLTGLALPIGISFFTFQGMSYVIDVYRGGVSASRSFFKVLLYLSFFPQLIAGPIVQYHDIQAQIDARQENAADTARGLRRFLIGLSKKLLLADVLGAAANAVFALPSTSLGFAVSWFGAICYTLQIFLDFSGYSDMAIGLGRMFGFTIRENFDRPYTASSIRGFWRRWHISLSSWFRDYLYIPLGGNRKGKMRAGLNKLLVFFVTGLWHGANWTFVLWGLWHGLFAMLEEHEIVPIKKMEGRWAGHVYTLLVVVFGFTLFRATSITQAGAMFLAMLTGLPHAAAGLSTVCAQLSPVFLLTAAVALGLSFTKKRPLAPRWETASYAGALGLLALCMLSLSSGSFHPFLYFQF